MSRRPPRVLSRSATGRWLGGVCAGMAAGRPQRLALIRAAFVAATLLAGLGVVAYLACWLILPEVGEAEQERRSSWLVSVAQACAVVLAMGIAGAAAATATLFGLGWVALCVAGAVLAVVILWWPRLGPAWAVLPVAALTLPSLAIAAGGIRLRPAAGPMTVAPARLTAGRPLTITEGVGQTLVDLRRTALPGSGTLVLRIHGGVRRTIVALPHLACVHVQVRSQVHPLVGQLAGQLTGRVPLSGIDLFGRPTSASELGTAPGPTLVVDLDSLGGSLYVRDYPDDVDPSIRPDWPGYDVHPEPRPDVRGTPRKAARRLLRAWRSRRAAQVRNAQIVEALMPGPCATGAAR